MSIRRGGDGPPIFFVPTGFGAYGYVFDLAESIDAAYPIYAMPWPHLNEAKQTTVEAMAQKMTALLQAVQPEGPYHLAGYSSGGAIAYAIAQHLAVLGEEVAFIGLLDTVFPSEWKQSTQREDPDGSPSPDAAGDIASLEKQFRKLKATGEIPDSIDLSTWIYSNKYHQALAEYEVPPLPVEIWLFNALENPVDFSRGWQAVLPAASIHVARVPGGHQSMITDPANRAVLCARLSEALRGTTAGRSSFR
jgi:thioesterase domain-containing protein